MRPTPSRPVTAAATHMPRVAVHAASPTNSAIWLNARSHFHVEMSRVLRFARGPTQRSHVHTETLAAAGGTRRPAAQVASCRHSASGLIEIAIHRLARLSGYDLSTRRDTAGDVPRRRGATATVGDATDCWQHCVCHRERTVFVVEQRDPEFQPVVRV